jgi:phosphatidate cytidylyltransferase
MANETAGTGELARKPNPVLQRILTVVPLLPVLIALLWWSVTSVAVVVFIAAFICLAEVFSSMDERNLRPYIPFWYIFAGALIGAALRSPNSVALLTPVMVIGTVVSLCIAVLRSEEDQPLYSWALSLATMCYIPLLLSHLILMRTVDTPLLPAPLSMQVSSGFAWIVFTLATTWLADTFAFFTGRSFGKTPLAPRLSPKKTWEGSIGGFVGAILTAIGVASLFGLPISLLTTIGLGAVAGILGPIGDLAESQIKRQLGVKDAGSILPGHGGMLDRIDSILFTVPVMYYIITYAL